MGSASWLGQTSQPSCCSSGETTAVRLPAKSRLQHLLGLLARLSDSAWSVCCSSLILEPCITCWLAGPALFIHTCPSPLQCGGQSQPAAPPKREEEATRASADRDAAGGCSALHGKSAGAQTLLAAACLLPDWQACAVQLTTSPFLHMPSTAMQAARRSKLATSLARARLAVTEQRRTDPLWVPTAAGRGGSIGCGVCPSCRQVRLWAVGVWLWPGSTAACPCCCCWWCCRLLPLATAHCTALRCPGPPLLQPWRTDLGSCMRQAAAKAAGHNEKMIVDLLAADPSYRTGGQVLVVRVVNWGGWAVPFLIVLAALQHTTPVGEIVGSMLAASGGKGEAGMLF